MTVPRRVSYFPRRDGKAPAGVKYVGRTSRFGNPHDHKELGRAEAVRRFRADWETGRARFTETDVLELAVYDALGCACPVTEPCHADVIIEIIQHYENSDTQHPGAHI